MLLVGPYSLLCFLFSCCEANNSILVEELEIIFVLMEAK